MRRIVLSLLFAFSLMSAAFAQTLPDIQSYCKAMAEVSTPTLLARIQNMSRAEAEAMMAGMTDPASIRMVKEVLNYAYSRPATSNLDEMRAELTSLCVARKIFVQ